MTTYLTEGQKNAFDSLAFQLNSVISICKTVNDKIGDIQSLVDGIKTSASYLDSGCETLNSVLFDKDLDVRGLSLATNEIQNTRNLINSLSISISGIDKISEILKSCRSSCSLLESGIADYNCSAKQA